MSNWQEAVYKKCRPLEPLIVQHIKSGCTMHMDETTVKVLEYEDDAETADGKPRSKSYMWLASGGPKGKPAVLFLTTISDVFLNRWPTLMRTPTGQSSCPGISRLLLGKIWASGDFFDGYQILACFDGYKQIVFKFRTFLEYLVKFFRKDYQNLSYQPQQDIFCYKYRKTQFVPIQHNCLFHLQPQYHQ